MPIVPSAQAAFGQERKVALRIARKPLLVLTGVLAALVLFSLGTSHYAIAADASPPPAPTTPLETSYCSVEISSETRINYNLYEWNPPFPPTLIGWNVTDYTIRDYSAPPGGITWYCDAFDSETPGSTYNEYL